MTINVNYNQSTHKLSGGRRNEIRKREKKINKLFFYGKLKFLFHHHKLVHKKTISPLPLWFVVFPFNLKKRRD